MFFFSLLGPVLTLNLYARLSSQQSGIISSIKFKTQVNANVVCGSLLLSRGTFPISQIFSTSLDNEERLLKRLLDEAFVLGVLFFFVSCQLQLCRCALSLTS